MKKNILIIIGGILLPFLLSPIIFILGVIESIPAIEPIFWTLIFLFASSSGFVFWKLPLKKGYKILIIILYTPLSCYLLTYFYLWFGIAFLGSPGL